ncbi:fimbrial protein [Citrobacter farmeri]|uniref:fimbrial protein n=1 Tax=Citrobacter farmeri TaxID=67824 RepID=UPI001908D5BF|nr:fimbrial protein [Citrobacter farmeri]EKV7299145.1 fimbrial protein [Citrobacter farmeri]MBJ8747052.1 fimbrial protein [Citrobacter farmeri]MBJ8761210.1 fimbrial protein [Citrobacter farmeri]MBJ9021127.1 fimbrial protein [Citrobacter farmeri]
MSTTLIQYGKRINPRGILFTLMLSAFIWSCLPDSVFAYSSVVHSGNGIARNGDFVNYPGCPSGGDWVPTGSGAAIVGNSCNILFGDVYVPKAGMYFIRFYVGLRDNHSVRDYADSTKFYLDTTKPISYQTGSISITTYTKYLSSQFINKDIAFCDVLVDAQGEEYSLIPGDACAEAIPLPPDPPAPETSCNINNGSGLSVHFDSIDRADLSTEPGVGNTAIKNLQIPVTCTGGVDVSVKMQLTQYTPLTINSTEVIKTTANGVGVAVLYNDQPLTSAANIPVTLKSGSNTLNLDFQAVRNPAVAAGDVPPGYFTASAVLVMTQQ